jgi:Leucine-rich repeat (LRR) protein
MVSWHFWITILFVSSTYLSTVTAGTAFCTFEHTTSYHSDLVPEHISGYLCKLDLDIKGDRVDNIEGSHENGENSNDVSIIMVFKDYHTYLTSFPNTFCSQFENLEIIDMSGAQIETVEDNSLQNCKNLRILQFYMNKIDRIPEKLLAENKKLLKLYISYNSISSLPENLLLGLSNLEILDLSYNQLMSIPTSALYDLRSLKELSLEGNKIEMLEQTTFQNLENIEKLSLASNKISELPVSIFSDLVNLKELMLQQNDLTVIHADSFPAQANINLVVLSKNKIDAIDEYFIDDCGITKLKMSGNICDRTAVIEKKDLKKKLGKCFKNYEDLNRGKLINLSFLVDYLGQWFSNCAVLLKLWSKMH